MLRAGAGLKTLARRTAFLVRFSWLAVFVAVDRSFVASAKAVVVAFNMTNVFKRNA